MKKIKSSSIVAICAIALSFGSFNQVSAQSILDDIKTIANTAGVKTSSVTSAIGNIIGSSSSVTTKDLIGTWKYNGSKCAFQSENMLAQAGGEIAAGKIESKLNTSFKEVGLKSNNTSFTFNDDKTFSAKIYGKNISGTYTYDEKNKKINCQGILLSFPCYVTKTGSNLNLLFDSSKLLNLFQVVSKFSGNTTLSTIGTLAKNYKGVKLGFKMTK